MNDSSTVSGILWRRFKSAQIQLPQGVSYGSHGLRHAFGARLVGTISLHELGAMLGHKDLSSTLLYSTSSLLYVARSRLTLAAGGFR